VIQQFSLHFFAGFQTDRWPLGIFRSLTVYFSDLRNPLLIPILRSQTDGAAFVGAKADRNVVRF
jgi:hypothetical protein